MAKKGQGVPTTGSERWLHLQEQMGFLRRSCQAFDEGHVAEAKRMANEVVKLVFNEGHFRAVLHQVGLMPGMAFISTCQPSCAFSHLTDIEILPSMSFTYRPPLEDAPHRLMLFQSWWKEIVFSTPAGRLTRGQLVRSLRDEFGGGHVDPEVSALMAKIVRTQIKIEAGVNNNTPEVIQNVELFAMRQIAYEVLISIERKLARG